LALIVLILPFLSHNVDININAFHTTFGPCQFNPSLVQRGILGKENVKRISTPFINNSVVDWF